MHRAKERDRGARSLLQFLRAEIVLDRQHYFAEAEFLQAAADVGSNGIV